jgi:ribosomal-protein-alanine N-acetyltransferase
MLKSAPAGGSLARLAINKFRSAVQLQESLPVSIRRLRVDDIDQVVAIEKEAFSPLWVSASFKRDLNNKRANYLVACFDEEISPEEILAEIDSDRSPQDDEPQPPRLWSRVLGRLGLSSSDDAVDVDEVFNIAGYVSVWYQGEEAHITEIAVKETLRGRGVGELLLIGSLKAAIEYGSKVMTLEARVSNFIAHRLYQKYSFKSVGIRKAYYSDNREDAVIMTTTPIDTPEYDTLFSGLQSTYQSRWGRMDIDEY